MYRIHINIGADRALPVCAARPFRVNLVLQGLAAAEVMVQLALDLERHPLRRHFHPLEPGGFVQNGEVENKTDWILKDKS